MFKLHFLSRKSYKLIAFFALVFLFAHIMTVNKRSTFGISEKSLYSALQTNASKISKESIDIAEEFDASYIFKKVQGSQMYSFYNVCVETRQPPVIQSSAWGTHYESQRVVIYGGLPGQNHSAHFERKNVSVAGSPNTKWNHWELYFTNASIPTSHTLHPTTAFFVSETYPENLYHSWNDLFLPLLSVVRESNRLHPGMRNQILYRNPRSPVNLDDQVCEVCRRSPYDIFLETLHTTNQFLLFYDLPTNTCFSSAVFGTRYKSGPGIRDGNDYVLKELKLSYKPRSTNKRIFFIERQYRRILNIHDLAREAKRIGFKNVEVIDLKSIPVLEQLKAIIDTDILIGVQGAALQWGTFMRNGSTVVEISWPNKYWGSRFSFLRDYGIHFVKFETNEAFVNWNEYENRWRKVNGSEERTRLLNSKPPSTWDNIWKFADITVNVKQFQELLKKLL